jgi:hypothetical protein
MLDRLKAVESYLFSAEQAANTSTENAKIATGIVASAAKTLESALAAVHSANLHAEDATRMARESVAALVAAKEEFAKLVTRG